MRIKIQRFIKVSRCGGLNPRSSKISPIFSALQGHFSKCLANHAVPDKPWVVNPFAPHTLLVPSTRDSVMTVEEMPHDLFLYEVHGCQATITLPSTLTQCWMTKMSLNSRFNTMFLQEWRSNDRRRYQNFPNFVHGVQCRQDQVWIEKCGLIGALSQGTQSLMVLIALTHQYTA